MAILRRLDYEKQAIDLLYGPNTGYQTYTTGGNLYRQYATSPGYGTTAGELGFLENLILSERSAVAGGADYRQTAYQNDLDIYNYQKNVQFAYDVGVQAPVFASPTDYSMVSSLAQQLEFGVAGTSLVEGIDQYQALGSTTVEQALALGGLLGQTAQTYLSQEQRAVSLTRDLLKTASPLFALGERAGSLSSTRSSSVRRAVSGVLTPEEIISAGGLGYTPPTGSGALTPLPIRSLGLSYFSSETPENTRLYANVDTGGVVRGVRDIIKAPESPLVSQGEAAQRLAFAAERDIARQFGMLGNLGLAKVRELEAGGLETAAAISLARTQFGLSPEYTLGGRTYGISGQERLRRADRDLLGMKNQFYKGAQSYSSYEFVQAAKKQSAFVKQFTKNLQPKPQEAFGFPILQTSPPPDYVPLEDRIPAEPGPAKLGLDIGYEAFISAFTGRDPLDRPQENIVGSQVKALTIDVPKGITGGQQYYADFERYTGFSLEAPSRPLKTVKPIATGVNETLKYEYPEFLAKPLNPYKYTSYYADVYEPIPGTGGINPVTGTVRPPNLKLKDIYRPGPDVRVSLDWLNY